MPRTPAKKNKTGTKRRTIQDEDDESGSEAEQEYQPTQKELEEAVPVEQLSEDEEDDEEDEEEEMEEEEERPEPPKKKTKKSQPAVQEKKMKDEFAVELSAEELAQLAASEERAKKLLEERKQGKHLFRTLHKEEGLTQDDRIQRHVSLCSALAAEQAQQPSLHDQLKQKLNDEQAQKLTEEMKRASAYGHMSEYEVARMQASLQPTYFANLSPELLDTISIKIKGWSSGGKSGYNATLWIGKGLDAMPLIVTGPPMPITRYTGPPYFNWAPKCDENLPHKVPGLKGTQYYIQSTCEAYDKNNATEPDENGSVFDKDAKAFYDFVRGPLREAVLKKLLENTDGKKRSQHHAGLLSDVRAVLRSKANLGPMETTDAALMARAKKETRSGHAAKRRNKPADELKQIQSGFEELINKGKTEEAQAYMEAHGDSTMPGTEMVEGVKDAFMGFGKEKWETWQNDKDKKLDADIQNSGWFRNLWNSKDTRLMLRKLDIRRGDEEKLPSVPLDQQGAFMKPGRRGYIAYRVHVVWPKSANSINSLGIRLEPHRLVAVGYDERFANSGAGNDKFSVPVTADMPTPLVPKMEMPEVSKTSEDELRSLMAEAQATLKADESKSGAGSSSAAAAAAGGATGGPQR